jgi:hypothetical protein
MYRLAFRKGTSETLLLNHSVDTGSGIVGVRWYEIRSDSGSTLATSRTLYQSGTYSPDNSYRWMGSIAEDKNGNVGMAYSLSSSLISPSIMYSGRAAGTTDPLGTFGSEVTLQTGSGSETGASRWGDYTSLSLDPADDCTFWYTNEFFKSSSSYSWSTRIASFRFSDCGTSSKQTSTTTISSSLNPSNLGAAVTFTATVTAGATGNVEFFDGATSLGVQPVNASQASVTTSTLSAGAHMITAVYGGDSAYTGSTSAVTQTVNGTTPTGSFSLTSDSASQNVARSQQTSFVITMTPSIGFNSDVALSASGLPPQSTATFSPASVTGGSGSSTLAIAIGRNTPKKGYTVTITGSGGGATASTAVTITVQ